MPNPDQADPAENQWKLLVEYGHGLHLGFQALWVETDDPQELSRRFRVDLESRLECDVKTLAGTYKGPPAQGVWIGPHAPGWTHAFVFGFSSSHPAIDNLGRRRVFQLKFTGEVGEGLFTAGLKLDPDTELEQDVHTLWCLAGRITGRFADREWWTSTRTFYRIPDEAWEH